MDVKRYAFFESTFKTQKELFSIMYIQFARKLFSAADLHDEAEWGKIAISSILI